LTSYAHYRIAGEGASLAESPEAVAAFLARSRDASRPAARADVHALERFAADHGRACTPLGAWDRAHVQSAVLHTTLLPRAQGVTFSVASALHGVFSVARATLGIAFAQCDMQAGCAHGES